MRQSKVKNFEECMVTCPHCREEIDVTAACNIWMAARAGHVRSQKKVEAAKLRWIRRKTPQPTL